MEEKIELIFVGIFLIIKKIFDVHWVCVAGILDTKSSQKSQGHFWLKKTEVKEKIILSQRGAEVLAVVAFFWVTSWFSYGQGYF